jgi:glyoxylase-like metal-dependent hydrolase (beta-lactamase superfamily II)
MANMQLKTAQVGPWGMNTYVLVCSETLQSVLIDPGADADILHGMLAGTTPIAILLTHTHIDHIGALTEMRQALEVPVMGNDGPHEPGGEDIGADRWLRDGDTVQVGQNVLEVVYAPGHIGDQICFAIAGDDRIVVGDTIFDGGPGRTWSKEGFQETLLTLKNVVLNWTDEKICYAGHGPKFRLGDRRREIVAFLNKDHGDFFGDATWDM